IQSWHLDRLWKCSEEVAVARVAEWFSSPEYLRSLPIPGSREAVARLAKYHELHIITSRSTRVEQLTRDWLDLHFPIKFAGLHFTNHFQSDRKSKAEVCKILDISLLVEDSPLHAQDVAKAGITVLLLDAPWNQEEVSEPIVRV